MPQEYETTIRVKAASADNAKKKIAVLQNIVSVLDDNTFEAVYAKIQSNPQALAKVKNFINFL